MSDTTEPIEIALGELEWGQYAATFPIDHASLSALMYAAETEHANKAIIVNRALLLYAMVLDADDREIVVIQEQAGNVWRRVQILRRRPRRRFFARVWNLLMLRKD